MRNTGEIQRKYRPARQLASLSVYQSKQILKVSKIRRKKPFSSEIIMMAMMMKMSIMLMVMTYDCRARNMNCFRAKPGLANSVAHLANGDDNDLGYQDD